MCIQFWGCPFYTMNVKYVGLHIVYWWQFITICTAVKVLTSQEAPTGVKVSVCHKSELANH